jgi:hypothetical protein
MGGLLPAKNREIAGHRDIHMRLGRLLRQFESANQRLFGNNPDDKLPSLVLDKINEMSNEPRGPAAFGQSRARTTLEERMLAQPLTTARWPA